MTITDELNAGTLADYIRLVSVKLFTVEKDASGNLVPGVEVKTLTEGAASSLD